MRKIIPVKPLVWLLLSVLLIVSMLLPSVSYAQTITLPQQAEGTVSVSEMTEMARLMAIARSATLLAYLDTLEELLPPVIEEVNGLMPGSASQNPEGVGVVEAGGTQTPEINTLAPALQIPDVSSLKKEYLAKIDSIAQAATIADAEAIINGLQPEAVRIQGILMGLSGQLMSMAGSIQEQGMGTKDGITEQIQIEVAEKAQAIQNEISQAANDRAMAFQAEIQAYAKQLQDEMMARIQAAAAAAAAAAASPGGGGGGGVSIDINTEVANLNTQINAKVSEFTKQLTEEINQLSQQKTAELSAWVGQRVEELKNEKLGPFFKLRDDFNNLNSQIVSMAAERQIYYDPYYQQFKDKKVEIIKKAMQPQIDTAIATIKKYGPDLELARKEGRGLPTEQELLNELQTSYDKLVQSMTNAQYAEDIDQMVANFKAYWEDKQKQLELARSEGSQEVITTTLQKLEEQNAESRLSDGRNQLQSCISQLEAKQAKGPLTDKELEYLNRCKMIISLIDEASQLIAQFKQAKPTDDIKDLLALKDKIVSKLNQVQQAVENLGDIPAGKGIFIEAENESFTKLLPRTESWHSVKEMNPKPTWRPEPSGWADWYLSRGGEVLGYYFNVDSPGNYIIWIRDIASTDHPAGRRAVTVQVDGKSYGSFPENTHPTGYPKGNFAWHATATVSLTAGKHTLELIKTATTSAAATIDCIFITNNPNEVPK